VLDSIPKSEVIILAGHFNDHLFADRSGPQSTMGNFKHGNIIDNGFYPRLTWSNPAGKDSAMLGYILIDKWF